MFHECVITTRLEEESIQSTALSQSSGATTLTLRQPHSHSRKHTHLVCHHFHTQIMIGTHSASAAQVGFRSHDSHSVSEWGKRVGPDLRLLKYNYLYKIFKRLVLILKEWESDMEFGIFLTFLLHTPTMKHDDDDASFLDGLPFSVLIIMQHFWSFM